MSNFPKLDQLLSSKVMLRSQPILLVANMHLGLSPVHKKLTVESRRQGVIFKEP